MFRDLDDTLNRILDDPTAPAELRAADVSFEMPDKNFRFDRSTINLFLYDVAENRELRDPEQIVENEGGSYVRRMPPLRVNCSYMVTTWSTETGPDRVRVEHRLLSQALIWLSRFPTIARDRLPVHWRDERDAQGRRNPNFQRNPLPTMVAQMNGNKSMGEFWTALGQPPRPSFNLVVTIAMDYSRQDPEGPPVVTKDLRFKFKDKDQPVERQFQIGGRIFETGNPNTLIEGAQVLLVEKSQTRTTNARGEFTFAELTVSDYTFTVSAPRYVTRTVTLQVPRDGLNAYDIGLQLQP